MQIKIDLKSLALGAVLGAVVVFTMAAATTSQTSGYGRYQLVIGESYVFKIDSESGQTWQAYAANPSKTFLYAPVPPPAPPVPQAERPVEK